MLGRRLAVWVIMAALPWWAFASHHLAWGVLLVLGEGGLYAWSVYRMPYVKCWMCDGSGTSGHSGPLAWIFPGVFRSCLLCRGRKVSPRLAIRIFQRGRAEKIRSGK